jgi:hypothetical protein
MALFIWFSVTLVAIVSGPFGSDALAVWPVRTLYWVTIATSAVVIGVVVRAVTAAGLGYGRPLLFDVLVTSLMTIVFAPLVWALRNNVNAVSGEPPVQFPMVALNTFLIAGLFFVTRRHTVATEHGTYLSPRQEVAAMPLQQPRLQRRLSEETTGMIIRLSSRDHHVDVVTTEGQETLRMRLIDAIDEMEPVEGYCTHRSHWVTRAAIVEVDRDKPGKIFLVLSNGDRVPVSRKYKPDLEAAGILD